MLDLRFIHPPLLHGQVVCTLYFNRMEINVTFLVVLIPGQQLQVRSAAPRRTVTK